MKLVSALVGVAALGGIALSSGSASAMPVAVPAQASSVVPVAYVCNEWGHCWHRPSYGYGYGDGYGWRSHYWHPHYWHPHYWSGGWGWHQHWGYGGWHRWHHWHSWNSGS